MSLIGRFKPSRAGGWEGDVRTLAFSAHMRFVPNDDRYRPGAPDFRVFVGWTHVGDAWTAPTRETPPRKFLRAVLDDPLFPRPITMALFFDDDEQLAELHWRRLPQRKVIIRRPCSRPTNPDRPIGLAGAQVA